MHTLAFNKKWLGLVCLIIACAVYFFLPQSIGFEGRSVLAVLTFAFFFWGFEITPLYSTSILIVVFLTFFFSLGSGGTETLFFSTFANPRILLFFGGFVLAAAVRKHQIDEIILSKVLTRVGSNSYMVLASIFVMGAFFSMWISNTASAAMMLALAKPLYDSLSEVDPMRKALPLSIAFSCNIGGMGTPIGTPPNAIAMGVLREFGVEVNFLNWIVMALPLVLIILCFAYLVIIFFFPAQAKSFKTTIQSDRKLSKEGVFVSLIALFMIVLWLTGSIHGISETWVALMGVGLFASFGLIETQDLKNIDWDVLILMWGGLALGSAIEKSGLLTSALPFLTYKEEFMVIAAFCVLAILLSTFISNTAAANLLMPFAVGIAIVDTRLIAIPVALCCSVAMILPVSTPPNALAYSWGAFSTKEIGKAGLTIACISLIVILIGFTWMIPWTF